MSGPGPSSRRWRSPAVGAGSAPEGWVTERRPSGGDDARPDLVDQLGGDRGHAVAVGGVARDLGEDVVLGRAHERGVTPGDDVPTGEALHLFLLGSAAAGAGPIGPVGGYLRRSPVTSAACREAARAAAPRAVARWGPEVVPSLRRRPAPRDRPPAGDPPCPSAGSARSATRGGCAPPRPRTHRRASRTGPRCRGPRPPRRCRSDRGR